MAKKEFVGEKQNLPQLVKDVEDWFRREGFEVQSAGQGSYLIQARKQSGLRSLLGSNQCIDVKIEGRPEKYSIEIDAGAWVKNLQDARHQAVTATVEAVCTLARTIWSGSERAQVENGLWALKHAACSACFRIGAEEGTGERIVRAEGVTMRPSGYYGGTKVLKDTFKCKFCAHKWEGAEKSRAVDSLCPKCYAEKSRVSTGEKIIGCNKTKQRNEAGQPVAEEVFTNTFRCESCSHPWNDGQKTRLVEVCPKCAKRGTRGATGEHVFSCTKTDQASEKGHSLGQQVFTNTFRCNACSQEWNDGQHARLVEVCPHCEKPGGIEFLGRQVLRNFSRHKMQNSIEMHRGAPGTDPTFTEKFIQVAIDYEAYVNIYRCGFCSKEWNTGEKTRCLS